MNIILTNNEFFFSCYSMIFSMNFLFKSSNLGLMAFIIVFPLLFCFLPKVIYLCHCGRPQGAWLSHISILFFSLKVFYFYKNLFEKKSTFEVSSYMTLSGEYRCLVLAAYGRQIAALLYPIFHSPD